MDAQWERSKCSSAKAALRKGELSGWKSVGGAKWGETTEADLESALQHGAATSTLFRIISHALLCTPKPSRDV